MSATIDTLITNASQLGKESQHVALAAAFVLPGVQVLSLCCWCADARYGWDVKAHRLPRGGECQACPYVGYDCLVLVPELPAPPPLPTSYEPVEIGLHFGDEPDHGVEAAARSDRSTIRPARTA